MSLKVSKVASVHMALRRAIVEQAIEPGAKLPEDAIGEQFGVSRTIVRRALEQLAADELVEIRPNRGASVVCPTLADARDLFQVRIDLEDVIAGRICGHLSPTQIGLLEKSVALEEAAHREKRGDYIRLSAEFHVLLADFTGSPLLARYMRQLAWRSALVLRLYGRPEWESCNLHEHRDLIKALASGNVEACRQLMKSHLESVLTRSLDGEKIPDDPSLKNVLKRYAIQETPD